MDSTQNTPLHLACSHGHDEVVNALVFSRQPKCKINVVNDEGNTPLHNAARWGFGECMQRVCTCVTALVFLICETANGLVVGGGVQQCYNG